MSARLCRATTLTKALLGRQPKLFLFSFLVMFVCECRLTTENNAKRGVLSGANWAN